MPLGIAQAVPRERISVHTSKIYGNFGLAVHISGMRASGRNGWSRAVRGERSELADAREVQGKQTDALVHYSPPR